MAKMTLVVRMELLFREYGALQVVKVTEFLNRESSIYGTVKRNTVNTLLYTNKRKFKKIGWGLFDLLDGSIRDIKAEILRKFIKYWDPNSIEFGFTTEELEIINKYKEEGNI